MFQIYFCLKLLLILATPAEAATRSDLADEPLLDTNAPRLGISAPLDPFSDTTRPVQNPLVQISIEKNPAADNHPGGNPLWAIPLNVLSVTRERPIFSVSRRPPPQAITALPAPEPVKVPPPQPAPPEVPRLALVGAVGNGDQGIAVFVDQSTRGIVRLKIGEAHSGWVLRQVRGRETTLEKDNRTVLLALPQPGDAQGNMPSEPAALTAGSVLPGLAPVQSAIRKQALPIVTTAPPFVPGRLPGL